MDPVEKLRHTIDALFGRGVSRMLPRGVDIDFSRRTGRIRGVSWEGRLLCTLRIDGGLAITPAFAGMLLGSRRFREDNCVEITGEAAPFVAQGRSVFARHVVRCGKNVRIAADVPVLWEGRVVAVGRAVLSAEMMADFERGVAVKVRDSVGLGDGAADGGAPPPQPRKGAAAGRKKHSPRRPGTPA